MADFLHPDRRRHPRAYVPAVASLYVENACVGRCLVRNLSQSGALLLGAPAYAPGVWCEIVLQAPELGTLRLPGQTVRAGNLEGEPGLALRFREVPADLEDQLRQVVERAQGAHALPSTLVVDADLTTLVELAADLGQLGRRAVLALTPLEAVRWLCDPSAKVDTVLACSGDAGGIGADLLAFIGDEFPAIQCVLVHGDLSPSELLALIEESNAATSVRRPWTLQSLGGALERGPSTRRPWRHAG